MSRKRKRSEEDKDREAFKRLVARPGGGDAHAKLEDLCAEKFENILAAVKECYKQHNQVAIQDESLRALDAKMFDSLLRYLCTTTELKAVSSRTVTEKGDLMKAATDINTQCKAAVAAVRASVAALKKAAAESGQRDLIVTIELGNEDAAESGGSSSSSAEKRPRKRARV